MGNQVVAQNQQNVSVRIRILDDSDGTPANGVVEGTTGLEIWYQRDGSEDTGAISPAVTDFSDLTTAHLDWAFAPIRKGYYRVDIPDAAFLEGSGSVICGIDATGFSGIATEITIEPLFRFQGQASSVTSTTTTFPAGTTPYVGDKIHVPDGTGIGQTRVIRSIATEVATHDAWDINISATLSTVLLIAGATDEDTSGLSTLTDTQVNTEVTDVLSTRLPATLSTAGNIRANIEEVNDITVTGDGETSTEWNPV